MTPEEKEKLRALAIELDDPFADDECPSCGQKLVQTHLYRRHYLPGTTITREIQWQRDKAGTPWPMTSDAAGWNENVCSINSDNLYARRLSRQLIRTGEITG